MYRFKIVNYLFAFIMLLVFYHFVNAIGIDTILDSIYGFGWNFVIVLFCYLMASMLASLSWMIALKESRKSPSYFYLLCLRLYTESISLLNPTNIISGDALKVFYLKTKHISTPMAINSVILSRMMLVISQLILIALVALYCISNFEILTTPNFTFWHLCFLLFLAIGLIYMVGRYLLPLLLDKLIFKFWSKKRTTYLRCIVLYRSGLENPKRLLMMLVLSILHWLAGGLELYLILHFLGVDLSIIHSVIADVSVATMKISGAFIPGQIGVEEFSLKFVLALIGVTSTSIWIAASVIRRIKQIVWIGLSLMLFSAYQLLEIFKRNQIGNIIRNA